MSVMLAIVHKTIGGHQWSNTHCIKVGTNVSTAPTDADLTAAGAATALTTTNTAGTPPNIVAAIVAAERAMHAVDVHINGVLLTDGKSNTGVTPATQYASMTCDLPGTGMGAAVQLAGLEAGGITLLVHRNVVGFGHKPGRLFFRGALSEGYVQIGGPRMIQWEGGTIPAAITTNFNAAVGFLAPYFSGGAQNATAGYCLPLYVTPKQYAANPVYGRVGTLYSAVDISGWSLVGPVLRQVQRGRKRKKTV